MRQQFFGNRHVVATTPHEPEHSGVQETGDVLTSTALQIVRNTSMSFVQLRAWLPTQSQPGGSVTASTFSHDGDRH